MPSEIQTTLPLYDLTRRDMKSVPYVNDKQVRFLRTVFAVIKHNNMIDQQCNRTNHSLLNVRTDRCLIRTEEEEEGSSEQGQFAVNCNEAGGRAEILSQPSSQHVPARQQQQASCSLPAFEVSQEQRGEMDIDLDDDEAEQERNAVDLMDTDGSDSEADDVPRSEDEGFIVDSDDDSSSIDSEQYAMIHNDDF